MRKAFRMLRHELSITMGSPHFLVIVFLMPALFFLLAAVPKVFREMEDSPSELAGNEISLPAPGGEPDQPGSVVAGLVDLPGLINRNLPGEAGSPFLQFKTENQARLALQSGQIDCYFLITADYLDTGLVYRYQAVPALRLPRSVEMDLADLLQFNLVKGDRQVFELLARPVIDLEQVDLSVPGQRSYYRLFEVGQGLAPFMPYIVGSSYWFLLTIPAMLMIDVVGRERANKVIEVLLTSASPKAFVFAKFVALLVNGMLLLLTWGASTIYFLVPLMKTFGISGLERLTPAVVGWMAVSGLAAYLLYGVFVLATGVLLPGLREANQVISFLTFPLIIPIFLYPPMIENPYGFLPVFLSLFPLTAPTGMVVRLMAAQVPVWQPILALILMLILWGLALHALVGLLRPPILLSGLVIRLDRILRFQIRRKE